MTPSRPLARWQRPLTATLALTLAVGAAAQNQPNKDMAAGYGHRSLGPYDLNAITGSQTLLGVTLLAGDLYISGRSATGLPPHQIFVVDLSGNLVRQFDQPNATTASQWGLRDGCTDGSRLAFGFEGGIHAFFVGGTKSTTFNGQPITNPINAGIGNHRGLALNPNGDAGRGSLWTGDFASPLYEIDLQGNILTVLPMPAGGPPWSIYGLAWDDQGTATPGDDTLWINSAPNEGEIRELDPRTGQYTGNAIQRFLPNSPQGGLDHGAGLIGSSNAYGLIGLDQSSGRREDTATVYRIDRDTQVPGETEAVLVHRAGNGALTPESPKFIPPLPTRIGWAHDVTANPGLAGRPAVTLINFGANLPSTALPGFPEVVAQINPAVILPLPVSPAPLDVLIPAGLGSQFRAQTVYFEPLMRTNQLAVTNQVFWDVAEIVVMASGDDSFNSQTSSGFFSITNFGDDPVTELELDWTRSTNPTHTRMEFDTDQSGMAGRFDAGNSAIAGCNGTYRNGSDVAAGLVYDAQNTVRGVPCAPASNCGWIGTNPGGDPGDYRTLRFRFAGGKLRGGVVFEFDCDTDGGDTSANEMVGLAVTVRTQSGRTLGPAALTTRAGQTRSFVTF